MAAPSKRVQQIIRVGIVFGTVSQPIPKDKANQGERATHRWTVYVRHPDDRCLSPYLESVTFVLHNSFANHRRTVTAPPYCITEVGWGEFDLAIELNFKPEAEEPSVIVSHFLRLFLDPPIKNDKLIKKPVISEQVDELIFVNPTEKFAQLCNIAVQSPPPPPPLPNQLTPCLMAFARANQALYDQDLLKKMEIAKQYAQTHVANVLYLTQQLKIHSQLASIVEQARQENQLVQVGSLPMAPPPQQIMGPQPNPAAGPQPR